MGTVTELPAFDVLSDALQSLGLQTRLFCHSELASPWCLAFPASDLAHFHYMERGGAWVRLYDSNQTVALSAGDLVVLPHGETLPDRRHPEAGAHSILTGDPSVIARLQRVALGRRRAGGIHALRGFFDAARCRAPAAQPASGDFALAAVGFE